MIRLCGYTTLGTCVIYSPMSFTVIPIVSAINTSNTGIYKSLNFIKNLAKIMYNNSGGCKNTMYPNEYEAGLLN